MQFLRANTQVKVVIGPVVAVGDGFTPVTSLDLSTADEAELLKHDAAAVTSISAATFAAITSADGYYNLTLTTSHTDTEGLLTVLANDDSLCLPVKQSFMVLAEAAYDSMFVAKDDGFMDVNIKTVGRADTQETEATNLEAACAAYSATRGLAGTALPAAAADAAGGLPISDAGGLDLDAQVGTKINDIRGYLDTEIAAILAAVDTEVASILADTNELQGDWVNGGRLDLLIDAIKAATDRVNGLIEDSSGDRFTQKALEEAPTGGSAPTASEIRIEMDDNSTKLASILEDTGTTLDGKLNTIGGYLDTEIAAILAAVDTEIASILADSNELQTDWANGGRLDLLIDAILADTNELQGDWVNGGRLDLILDARASQSSVDTIDDFLDTEVAAILAAVDTEVASILVDTGTDIPASIAALLTTAVTESYRATNAAPTVVQALCELLAHHGESSISGTTKTTKRFDGSTTAKTYTLNDATTPTAITEAT